MARYHINPSTGNPGECHAQQACPFGSASDHFNSEHEARQVYEARMTGAAFPSSAATVARDEAVKAQDRITRYIEHVESEDFQGTSAEIHAALADSYRELAEAAEMYALRTTDEDEQRAWRRTAARAALEEVSHERLVAEQRPRELRGTAEERASIRDKYKAKIAQAQEAWEDVREDYRDNPAGAVNLAARLHDEAGDNVDDFFSLPAEEQQHRMDEAKSALNRVDQFHGNIELASSAIYEDDLRRVGVSDQPTYVYLDEAKKEAVRHRARAAYEELKY